jgi:A/G-specific adenine glycosylase
MSDSPLHAPVLEWYAEHARDLPWRRPGVSAWGVLVSEVMLQQTPVVRVLPVWEQWLERWPRPSALAGEAAGEAVRLWGRLGYPRRALRLHAAAVAITERHAGIVPSDLVELRALPGIGDYTAAAVAAFAYGESVAVLDTNVRRVLARADGGREFPADHQTVGERARATELLPEDPALAPTWSVAVMELGALVCRAGNPICAECPVKGQCTWRAAGYPAYDGPPRRGQAWAGTDRQCRGRLMAVVRDSEGPVGRPRLDAIWDQAEQRERCLAGLVVDGLLVEVDPGYFALP